MLMKEDDGIYWYIYEFCVIICIKLNSSSLQVLYLYKRGELLMNQRKDCADSEYQGQTSGAGVTRIDRIIEVYGT